MSKPMNFSRRQALVQTLFGAGAVGLRALATGLPASFLINPRRALAAACVAPAKAQYVIMSTSAAGDPLNANVPGTYGDSRLIHSSDAQMAATTLSLSGRNYQAARPWSTLPPAVLNRTVFWHLMTNTPIHPKEPEVLGLMGAVPTREMLPSLIAKVTAPCLNTIQPQPLSVAGTPSEALSFDGLPLPSIPPVSLRDTLTMPAGPLTNLMGVRDATLNQLHGLYKTTATPAQKAFIDNLVVSQSQVRSLNQSLLSLLSSIQDNSVDSQILAAVALIRMNVAPVITLHIPFGGDNHADAGLADETAETVSGVTAIGSLMAQLQSAGLQDRVTFMTLNVFGRTLASNGGQSATTGRTHNGNHQVSVTIGSAFRGGVVGGVVPVGNDFGASAIDSTNGAARAGGDIAPIDSLGTMARTVLQGLGGNPAVVSRGKVINSVLV